MFSFSKTAITIFPDIDVPYLFLSIVMHLKLSGYSMFSMLSVHVYLGYDFNLPVLFEYHLMPA